MDKLIPSIVPTHSLLWEGGRALHSSCIQNYPWFLTCYTTTSADVEAWGHNTMTLHMPIITNMVTWIHFTSMHIIIIYASSHLLLRMPHPLIGGVEVCCHPSSHISHLCINQGPTTSIIRLPPYQSSLAKTD